MRVERWRERENTNAFLGIPEIYVLYCNFSMENSLKSTHKNPKIVDSFWNQHRSKRASRTLFPNQMCHIYATLKCILKLTGVYVCVCVGLIFCSISNNLCHNESLFWHCCFILLFCSFQVLKSSNCISTQSRRKNFCMRNYWKWRIGNCCHLSNSVWLTRNDL